MGPLQKTKQNTTTKILNFFNEGNLTITNQVTFLCDDLNCQDWYLQDSGNFYFLIQTVEEIGKNNPFLSYIIYVITQKFFSPL